ncbi:TnsA endonuclease N-terminal domain-containing protein [Pseudofulvibacter geojedonensis]|uniref:TnsA endonuclease N-terminal domain-containing protein n=1 Tax=Pseudofulvibacter geojedonensis TaxID=1123758 RepID=A0ABW3HYY4_9FLAO
MIKNTGKKLISLQKKMINSYLDDEFYSFFKEEVIISLKKVREIGLKNYSLSGNITSLKTNDFVSFESSLERDFINCLEFDNSVLTYCEQPIKIFFTSNSKEKYYVPDFYIKYNDERIDELVEVKYKTDLSRNKQKYEDKFKAAKIFCDNNNMIFKILDENYVRTPFMENCKFLLPFRRLKNNIDFIDVGIIEERIKNHKHPTPNNIIIQSNFPEDRKAELLHTLWFMIANYIVNIDLENKINMNSKIWI